MSDRYLRRREVELTTGLCRSSIYRRISEGSFPAPYHLGGNCVRWKESDLIEWKNSHRRPLLGANNN